MNCQPKNINRLVSNGTFQATVEVFAGTHASLRLQKPAHRRTNATSGMRMWPGRGRDGSGTTTSRGIHSTLHERPFKKEQYDSFICKPQNMFFFFIKMSKIGVD
jgi:hypothetical protein